MHWSIETSPLGAKPKIISEYVLNELGIFIKRERRMPKNNLLTKTTGFRVGYELIKNTEYRAAPYDRNAILWYKITQIVETESCKLLISGNSKDHIEVVFFPENKNDILRFIQEMQQKYPQVTSADEKAAAWMCWRDDDEWEEPFASLETMIESELDCQRFIEPEILEETILKN